jgi:hypothetical protein
MLNLVSLIKIVTQTEVSENGTLRRKLEPARTEGWRNYLTKNSIICALFKYYLDDKIKAYKLENM